MLHTSKTSNEPPKKKIIFSLPIQPGCHLSIQVPTTKVLIVNRATILYLDSKTIIYLNNQLSHSNNPPAPFTGWIEQRHKNTMSDSFPPNLDGEMLLSRSGIQPKQLNIRNLISTFSQAFLDTVLMNVFLWLVPATLVVLNRNVSQAETTLKSKLYEDENMSGEKSFRLNL